MVDALVAETLAGISTTPDVGAFGGGGGWNKGKGWGGGWGKGYKGVIKGGKGYGKQCPLMQLGIDPNQPQDLMLTANELWDACINLADERGLEVAWAKVKVARQQIQKESGIVTDGGSALDQSLSAITTKKATPGKLHERMASDYASETPDQKAERKRQLMQKIIDMLKIAPNCMLEATKIMNDPEIRTLRVGFFDKFISFCTNNWPDYFDIERIPGKTQFNVVLKDMTIETVDMSLEKNPRGAFTKKRW